jgi:hypothetical protein
MNLQKRISIEKEIATKIVDDALALNYTISVNACEEWTVKRSKNRKEILDALMTTDDDTLVFRDMNGNKIGWVWLVYGNDGYDVVCDYTDNIETCELLAGADALSDKYYEDFCNG